MILFLHPLSRCRLSRLVEFHLTGIELNSSEAVRLKAFGAESFDLHGGGDWPPPISGGIHSYSSVKAFLCFYLVIDFVVCNSCSNFIYQIMEIARICH
jgi:hypothetical protein